MGGGRKKCLTTENQIFTKKGSSGVSGERSESPPS